MDKKLYILMCFNASGIFVMQKAGFYLPEILNNYANDLLCLPLVLGGISFAIRKLKRDKFFKFPLSFMLFMALYYSVYFEYYLPINNPRYTSDWIDVTLYFSGALFFYGYENLGNFRFKFAAITKINLSGKML